jgi:hypothetical protein
MVAQHEPRVAYHELGCSPAFLLESPHADSERNWDVDQRRFAE